MSLTVEQEQYQRLSSRLHAQTGSFDVYKCTPNTPPGAQSTFLIKILRSRANIITREMLINAKTNWARLETEAPDGVNIVKLVTMQDGIATTFYEHGDILQYHLKFPDAEPLPMLVECARTLAYLHAAGVVHGNVCTRNFLVDSSGHAYLSDIGIHEGLRVDNFTPAWRYLPFTMEYREDQRLIITAVHDVHMFGMLIYELYAKQKPFHHLKDLPQTLPRIAMGLPRLTQPSNMPNQLWKLVQDCINNDTPRPSMHDVEQRLITIGNEGRELVKSNT